jgi:1-piperideine-2-carboxylate/1-pyrroline-2-carboxylate reductase [NAD(P)H]
MNSPSTDFRILDAGQTRGALPYDALSRAIGDMLRRHAAGQVRAPERWVIPLDRQGLLLLMPATDGRLAVTKLVTVHPENRRSGLPTIQGEVIVLDAGTGRRLGILDGVTVTARRTAALSLLAARTLAPVKTGPLLLVGAGVQARAHLEAFGEALGVGEVYIV